MEPVEIRGDFYTFKQRPSATKCLTQPHGKSGRSRSYVTMECQLSARMDRSARALLGIGRYRMAQPC